MKAVMVVAVGRLLAAAICAVSSGVLAFDGKDGWGWFLFATIFLGSITVGHSSDNKDAK